MNTKIFVFIFLFVLVLMVRAADEAADTNTNTDNKADTETDEKANTNTNVNANTNANTNTNNNNKNNNNNANTNTDANTTTDVKTDDKANTNTPTNNNSGNTEDNTNKNNDLGDGPIDTINNTNTTLDACGTTSSQLGMFSFSKPISKSVLVQFSNFTIIWYYNNIIYDNYAYPTNNITISLFYEEDGNSNNWASSWKNPVWEKTLAMSEIEEGPTLTNNVRSYQWNWRIMYDDKGANTEGFKQSLRTNEKYKLRISGDGKDIQRNENLKCYQDGDIMPGTTRAFYIVENNYVPIYSPMKITDGAFSISSIKILSQIIFSIVITFFYLLIN